MSIIVRRLLGLAIAIVCGGCTTTTIAPINHLYDGAPLPPEEVAILMGDWRFRIEGWRTLITAVDGKEVGDDPYAVLPGTHTVTAYNNVAEAVVLSTGISTTPELRTSTGFAFWSHYSAPGHKTVSIASDDKRLIKAREDLKRNTMRTVTFTAEAGKKYVVCCELTKEFTLTERGVWVEDFVNFKTNKWGKWVHPMN